MELPSWLNAAPAAFGTTQHGKLSADQWRTVGTLNLPITLIRTWGAEVSDAVPDDRLHPPRTHGFTDRGPAGLVEFGARSDLITTRILARILLGELLPFKAGLELHRAPPDTCGSVRADQTRQCAAAIARIV